MINEDRIPEKALDQLVELWKVVTLDEKILVCQQKSSEEIETKPPILNWMSDNSWMFMNEYCKIFEECNGNSLFRNKRFMLNENLLYFIYVKNQSCFFHYSFCATLFSSLMVA